MSKSNVVQFKTDNVSEEFQTPFQKLLLKLHTPVDKVFDFFISPIERLLENADAGTNDFREYNDRT